jgi:hypothetical protein
VQVQQGPVKKRIIAADFTPEDLFGSKVENVNVAPGCEGVPNEPKTEQAVLKTQVATCYHRGE